MPKTSLSLELDYCACQEESLSASLVFPVTLYWFKSECDGPSYRKPPLALLIAGMIIYHLSGNNVFRFLSPSVGYAIREGGDQVLSYNTST